MTAAIRALTEAAQLQHRLPGRERIVRIDCRDDEERNQILATLTHDGENRKLPLRVIRVATNRNPAFAQRTLATDLLKFTNRNSQFIEHIRLHGWTPDLESEFEQTTAALNKKNGSALTLVIANPRSAELASLQAAGEIFDIFRRATGCCVLVLCLAHEKIALDLFGEQAAACPTESTSKSQREPVASILERPEVAWRGDSFVKVAARNIAAPDDANVSWSAYSAPQALKGWSTLFYSLSPNDATHLADKTVAEAAATFPAERVLEDGLQCYDDLCWFALLFACTESGHLPSSTDQTLAETVYNWQFPTFTRGTSVPATVVQAAIEARIVRLFGSPAEVARCIRRFRHTTWLEGPRESTELQGVRNLLEGYITEALSGSWPPIGKPLQFLDSERTERLATEITKVVSLHRSSEIALVTYLLRCLDLHGAANANCHRALAECARKISESAARHAASRNDPLARHRALLQHARALIELNNLDAASASIDRAKELRRESRDRFTTAPPSSDEHATFLEISTEMRLAEARARLAIGTKKKLSGPSYWRLVLRWRREWVGRLSRLPQHTGHTIEDHDWHDDAIAICISRWYLKHIDRVEHQIRNIHEARQVIAFARLAHECWADISGNTAHRNATVKLFVSYRGERRNIVEKIHAAIAKTCAGVEPWMDKDAKPGTRWSKEILLRLLVADAVLVVESPSFHGDPPNSAYEDSDWCKNERAISIKRNRRFGTPKVIKISFREFFHVAEPIVTIRTRESDWNVDFDPTLIVAEICSALAPLRISSAVAPPPAASTGSP